MVVKSTRRQVLAGLVLGAASLPRLARAAERPSNEAFEVTRQELWLPGLDPTHDGLLVAQLSDIHTGGSTPDGRVLRAVQAVNAARPDLVVLTGDYVTRRWDPIEHIPLVLGGLAGPVVATLGNHDHWTDPRAVRAELERAGYAVLQNRNTAVTLRGAPFTLVGIDDSTTRSDDVAAAFKGAPGRGSRLVLAHAPPTFDKLPPDAGLLCLSGHTHGGQVSVPGLTDRIFATAGQPYVRGLYEARGNRLYVNRGLGFGRGTAVPRLGSEPEVALITLRRAEGQRIGRT